VTKDVGQYPVATQSRVLLFAGLFQCWHIEERALNERGFWAAVWCDDAK